VTTGSQAVNARAPSQVRRLVLAVTFLTGLPVPLHGDADEADLWGSMGWYPLVGLGLGSVGWLLYAGSLWLVTPAVAAVLTVALLELATRALHLDGLMDTCDGYFSGRSRERALEIMKDSRVGAMGVVGALAVVLLKVTALASLGRHGAVVPLLVGWTAARTLSPIDVRAFRYARDEGTGAPFAGGRSAGPLVLAAASCVAAALVVGALVAGAAGAAGALLLVGATMGIALLAQVGVGRRLGGLTGDVYGAGVELVEAFALVAGCVAVTRGW